MPAGRKADAGNTETKKKCAHCGSDNDSDDDDSDSDRNKKYAADISTAI